MSDLELIVAGLVKMGWLLLPIILLIILWGFYEAIERKWERRIEK